jgi:L-threonylcarbamoyladenylate synthase
VLNLRLQRAADLLLMGGIVAYPTEAVYGLGCMPLDRAAITRLLAIKSRPMDKGLILIAANFGQLADMVSLPGPPLDRAVQDSWPGPVTWLLSAAEWVPHWLTGDSDKLAVRVTDHPLAAELCLRCGSPLVSTSANRAGRPPLRSPLAVRRQLGEEIDGVLVGPLGGQARPSQIRDGVTGEIVRPS